LRQLRTPEVAGLVDALTATSDIREQLSLQHTVLGAATRAGSLVPDDVSASQAIDTLLARAIGSYRLALTPDQVQRFGLIGDELPVFQQRTRVKTQIALTQVGLPIPVESATWDTVHADAVAVVQAADANARVALGEAGVAAEENASNLAGINSVILMLGLLAAITVAVLVARALIRSLRVLRTSALDVAERRLPMAVESMRSGEAMDVAVDPVPIDTRDEVGQVARAFDAVHGQAVRLAADQAALQTNVSSMFVNLSRRSQALVERQLQLIEQLESNEQDADQLANLFQLDHLATRMRRNSENLLVLAGTDLAKRNTAPVPMVDVLRAAVSEIEQYQRIVVQAPPSASIVGRAASDLVHLLAELLDNATNFSPPDSQVVMSTTRTTDGSLLVEIADRGVGMLDHEWSTPTSALRPLVGRRVRVAPHGAVRGRSAGGPARRPRAASTSSTGGPGSGLTASVHRARRPGAGAEGEQSRRTGSTTYGVPPQRVAATAPRVRCRRWSPAPTAPHRRCSSSPSPRR
jgi:signal transduction histidine kinase